mmetsp:Transcript_3272/g.5074  ORF Transcript_3272/g.5074 Transcript_3272/m.5074 type:complete len:153 (+) Transcript_3272:34-492(+)
MIFTRFQIFVLLASLISIESFAPIALNKARTQIARFSTAEEQTNQFDDSDEFYDDDKIPGKIKVDDDTLAKQQVELENFARELRRQRLDKEAEENRFYGWTPKAELLNGRMSMFFFAVGCLTEIWTGESLPQQVETMASVLGLLPLDYESFL